MKNAWGAQERKRVIFLVSLCIGVPTFAVQPVKAPPSRKAASTTAVSPQTKANPLNTATPKLDVDHISELAGVWSTGCIAETRTDMTLSFSKDLMTGKIARYLDEKCATRSVTLVQVYKVTPGERMQDTPADARAVDTTLISFNFIPETKDEAASYSKLYGVKMAPQVMSEVTGIKGLPKKGLVTYTIYRMKGDVLELGERDSYFKMGRPSKFSKISLKKQK